MTTCAACGTGHAEGARFCVECGARLAAPEAVRRKTVSIVFVDLVGSTALGERLDPEVLSGVLARYFEAVRSCLVAHGGTVEKYIGDAIVGVFGIPEVHEDDALRAVRAAHEVTAAVERLAGEVEREHGERPAVRIGVATGEVLAHTASAGTLMSGDAGNLAARLEQAAGAGETLLAPSTYVLVRDAVDVEPMGPLLLKGKAEPVAARRLLRVRDGAPAVVRVPDAPLVGRRRQLAGAMLAYEVAVEDRACALLSILGEPGVGKSRLAAEVVGRVETDARVLAGRCLPYGRGITYWPVAEMVRQVCGGVAGETGGDDLAAMLQSTLAGVDQSTAVAANLAAIAGGGAEASHEEVPWALRKLLEHLAADRPVVAFFEDIHWAEPALLDLIENVVEWSREAPVLVLCTARPELLDRRPAWGGGRRRATTILLETLSDGEAADLIRQRLGGEVDAATQLSITSAADGNPLFIEQLVAMLVENGRLSGDGGGWRMSAADELRMPPSIQALLAARLDNLGESERTVVDVASVVGKEFDLDALVSLTGSTGNEVSVALRSLQRRDVVRAEGGSLRTYRFHHILIRDAAYNALSKERRAQLHERFAAWLEETSRAGAADLAEIIGYHLEQASAYVRELRPTDTHAGALAAKAAAHLAVGGRRALRRGDMAAAVELLRRARGLSPRGSAEQRAVELALATALEAVGSLDDARTVLDDTVRSAREAGDRRLELHARLRLASMALASEPEGAAQRCRSTAEEAISIFTAAGDHAGLSLAWDVWGEPDHFLCRWGPMIASLERALSEARIAGDSLHADGVISMLAHACAWGPMPVPDAIARCRQLLEEAGAAPHMVARIRGRIGVLMAMAGRDEQAVAEITAAEAMYRELGLSYLLGAFGLSASNVHLWAGRLDDAEAMLRWADEALAQAGERSVRSTVVATIALVQVEQGRIDDADRAALLALELASSDDLATVVPALATRAVALAHHDRAEEALALARDAVDKCGVSDMPFLIGLAWEGYGRVLLAAGRPEEADKALLHAIAAHRSKGADALVARAERWRPVRHPRRLRGPAE